MIMLGRWLKQCSDVQLILKADTKMTCNKRIENTGIKYSNHSYEARGKAAGRLASINVVEGDFFQVLGAPFRSPSVASYKRDRKPFGFSLATRLSFLFQYIVEERIFPEQEANTNVLTLKYIAWPEHLV